MPTSVALGTYFEEFVKKQLAAGRYNNASEVIRAGLRLLEHEEKMRALKERGIDSTVQSNIQGVINSKDGPVDDFVAQCLALSARTSTPAADQDDEDE